MTTKSKKLIIAAVALLLAGGVAVSAFVFAGGGTKNGPGRKVRPSSGSKNVVLQRKESAKSQKIRQKETAIKTLNTASENERVKLSDAYKALLAEIKAALEAEDRDKLVAIVRRMQDSSEWPDGIPSILHKAAIDAMEWFGTSTAPELVGYLAVSDAEVAESVLEAMEDMLSDVSIGDTERSELLLSYAKVVKDADTLESMIMELDNMRPKTRAETVLELYKLENPTLNSLLDENIDTYFDDYDDVDVVTKDDLAAFIEADKKAHDEDPDLAEEEEEMYGADKDDD